MLKKYRHCMNPTACATKLMVTNRRGGLTCPPYGTVLHNCNRLRHLVLVPMNWMDEWIDCADAARLGGHVSPPLPMLGTCAISTASRSQTMVSINQMDRMDCLYKRNALGRIYKSAPTARGYFFNSPK